MAEPYTPTKPEYELVDRVSHLIAERVKEVLDEEISKLPPQLGSTGLFTAVSTCAAYALIGADAAEWDRESWVELCRMAYDVSARTKLELEIELAAPNIADSIESEG